ncbi:MAG: hypothetical protein DCC88_00155 [Spirobacillus cienkowskii]|uniref:Uncharacterized protein n=1 Tax=Spirobacillus cienkowskii TaxID=495820 RepID=A0A369KUT5_9BACT|nr:MAG: hypothetical protein DCC88_00155 [Spirobacillus cienkowskii]
MMTKNEAFSIYENNSHKSINNYTISLINKDIKKTAEAGLPYIEYKIYFKDYCNNNTIIEDLNLKEQLLLLKKEKKLCILLKYLEKLGYHTKHSHIIKYKFLFKEEVLGFKLKIFWDPIFLDEDEYILF